MSERRYRRHARWDLGVGQTALLIIVLVILMIGAFVVFLVLPEAKDTFGTCGSYDVDHVKTGVVEVWWDPKTGDDYASASRKIIYYPDGMSGDLSGFKWHYISMGYNSFYSPHLQMTKQMMIERVQAAYDGGLLDEHGYDWFICAVDDIP